MVTIERLKRRATVGDDLQHDLNNLPSFNERNEMILAIMIRPLNSDYEVLQFCDTLEDVIDDDSTTSKRFIHNLRSGIIYYGFYCVVLYCQVCLYSRPLHVISMFLVHCLQPI